MKCSDFNLILTDSAGGSAKEGRDRNIQAIFALKGKPLNANDTDMNHILDPKSRRYNKELSDLVNTVGTGIDNDYNDEKRKYARFIIMADSDIDGYHIQSLLMTFFFRHMPKLIENGRLFIAMSPLYRVREGNSWIYLIDDAEYDNYIYKRIIDIFEAKIDNKKMEPKAFRKFLIITKAYLNKINDICKYHCVDMKIIESILFEYWNKFDLKSEKKMLELGEAVSSKFNLEASIYDDNSLEIEGLYNTYHHFFINNKFYEDLLSLKTLLNSYGKLPIIDNSKLYLGEMLKLMYDKGNPKVRNRLKGLGESNPEELWETTMNPDKRMLVHVNIEDFENASNVFELWMGKKAEIRRDFLDENKHLIDELDI